MNSGSRSPLTASFIAAAGMLKARRLAVFIAIICFAMIMAVASATAERRTADVETQLAEVLSMSTSDLRTEVEQQIQALGNLPFAEFVATIENRYGDWTIGAEVPALDAENVGITYALRVTPMIMGVLVFHLFVLFVAVTFFLLLFTAGPENSYETLHRLPMAVFRMIGLSVWLLVRSWIWLPFIGPFVAAYRIPRLVLAPVILARGTTGVFQSLRESLRQTKGKWARMVVRMIAVAVAALAFLWPLIMMSAIAGLFSLKIGFFLWLASVILIVAIIVAAWVATAETL